jgi:tetratricopeptide (TPR) repeat protein
LSIVFWGRLSAPAYAIEQTIEALQNIRFLHIIGHDETGRIADERWIEIGPDGSQVRYRQENPAPRSSSVIEDGVSTAVYRHDKKAVILYDRNDKQFQWVGPLRQVFENLHEAGTILRENDEYQGRRVHKVWWPMMGAECYVDPKTKLPIAVGRAVLSYEEPPAGTFEIVLPEGYTVLDKRPGAAAAAVPDWLQQEDQAQAVKNEALRQGAYALVRGDYAEAARQLEQAGGSDTWARFWLGKASYELGRYNLAIQNFDAVFEGLREIGAGDTIPFCQYARGLAYARLGQWDKAKADFEACLPAMIRTLRTPSGGVMFEYADSPLFRTGQYEPGDGEIVTKMINRLRRITGQNFGYDPNHTKEQNDAALAAWGRWFKTDGRVQFTPEAPQLAVPAEWVNRLGWGRKSSQQIVARYSQAWLDQITETGALMKIGFALYDTARYEEALAVFGKMEETGMSRHSQVTAIIWQGHMLDLLGRREEALARYRRVADLGLTSGTTHAQYGLSFEFSPYARERLATPFTRVENTNGD